MLPEIPFVPLPAPRVLPAEINLPPTHLEIPQVVPPALPSASQMRESSASDLEEVTEEIRNEAPAITAPKQLPPTPIATPLNVEEPQFKEVTEITLPGTDLSFPVPRGEILSTAVITAGASSVAAVAGTLAASTLLKQLVRLLQPVLKIGVKRLAVIRGRPAPETFGRRRWKSRRNRLHRNQYRV